MINRFAEFITLDTPLDISIDPNIFSTYTNLPTSSEYIDTPKTLKEDNLKIQKKSTETIPSITPNNNKVTTSNNTPTTSKSFTDIYNKLESSDPKYKKYRQLLTNIAKQESNFDFLVLNKAGAPAYGAFLFMDFNIKPLGVSIEQFRNNPELQIKAAVDLADLFKSGFTKQDLELAKKKGYSEDSLIAGAWLGGIGGVRKVLYDLGNPSDKHWSKEGKGTTVKDRMDKFNKISGMFKLGGEITNPNTSYDIALSKEKKFRETRKELSNKYSIPYIPSKSITLTNAGKDTGVTISTNMLDSLAKYANIVKLPIEQAIGLAAQESTFGYGRGYKKQDVNPIDLLSNWNYTEGSPHTGLLNTVSNRVNIEKKPNESNMLYTNRITEEENKLVQLGLPYADSLLEKIDMKVPPILHALELYKTGKYNTGDSRHTKMVLERGNTVLSSPEVSNWYKSFKERNFKSGGVLKYKDGNKVDPTILEHMKKQGIVLPSLKNEQVSADNRTKELRNYQETQQQVNQNLEKGKYLNFWTQPYVNFSGRQAAELGSNLFKLSLYTGVGEVAGTYALQGLGVALTSSIKNIPKPVKDAIVAAKISTSKIKSPIESIPNNVGWAPKQSIKVVHDKGTTKLPELYYPERWDAVHEGAPKAGIWFQGKFGEPRTILNNSIPGKAEKAEKARKLFENRPVRFEGELLLDKPLSTVGDVPNRADVERLTDKIGSDGIIFNNIYDNGYANNQVIFSFRNDLKNARIYKKTIY